MGISRPRRLIRPSAKEESEARRRSWRWPLPISAEHAALRDRIERDLAALFEQIPEGKDLDEAVMENPELATPAAELMVLMREEQDFLAGQGVDPRPWGW